ALGIYGEDNDLGWRLLRAGYQTLYCPSAKVTHNHLYTTGGALRNGYREGCGAARLHYKHNLWLPRDLAPLVAAVACALLAAISRIFAWGAVGCFLLFIAALLFNEIHYKAKSYPLALLVLPFQLVWYAMKFFGFFGMVVRILLRLEPDLIESKRRYRSCLREKREEE
ncbi:MAG: hypothetical protein V2A74_07715, partial [bacterium]